MLKSELVQTDKHSIKILLRRKNLRFLRRTNHYTNTLAASFKENLFSIENYLVTISKNKELTVNRKFHMKTIFTFEKMESRNH